MEKPSANKPAAFTVPRLTCGLRRPCRRNARARCRPDTPDRAAPAAARRGSRNDTSPAIRAASYANVTMHGGYMRQRTDMTQAPPAPLRHVVMSRGRPRA